MVFLDFSHIQYECEEYLRILRGIPSIPQNAIMNLNKVMKGMGPKVQNLHKWNECNKLSSHHR